MPLLLIKLGLWWTGSAWPWITRNWKWLLGVLAAIVLFLLGRRSGRTVVVADDQESDAATTFQRDITEKADADVATLDSARAEDVKEATVDAKEAVDSQLEEQREDAPDLLKDPEDLNDFLKDVGKRQRQ